MKFKAKSNFWIFSAALLAVLLFTGCPNNPSDKLGKPVSVATEDFVPGETSVEQAQNMAIGWNLGNTLDAASTGSKTNKGLSTETSWSQPKTTQAMIKAVRAAGFKTIRIPVSWHNHITDSNYTIDSTWMARVKTIVDWSLEEGMCVILNIHHDNLKISEMATTYGFALSNDASIQAASKKYISTVWTQIAKTFANYDNNLVFEVLNEPRDAGGEWTKNEWGCNNSSVFSCITAYEQVGIDAIRATGGKNADRFIMVPGYAASGSDSGMLAMYKMPTDEANDRLILSTHAYSPYNFAMYDGNTDNRDFGDSEKTELESIFDYLYNNYVKKGIGVVMGEASASNKENLADREAWFTYYFGEAYRRSIPTVLWDNGAYTPDTKGSEQHGYFNRNAGTWYFPTIIEAAMKAVYGDNYDSGETGDSDNKDKDNPSNDSFEPKTLFNAETYDGSEEIVTINGKKFMKLTINGYDTSFSIPATDCNGGTTFTVECMAEEEKAGVQIIVGIKDSSYKDISSPAMNPLVKTVSKLTGTISSGASASSSKIASIIQPMAQDTTSNWSGANGVVFYISKITVE